MYEDLNCKIYIDTELSRENLAEIISNHLGSNYNKFFSLETECFNIDIINNKEYQKEKSTEFPDGFLYYRYFIEIEPQKNIEELVYIKKVGEFLNFLWKHGFKVVAS